MSGAANAKMECIAAPSPVPKAAKEFNAPAMGNVFRSVLSPLTRFSSLVSPW